MLGILRPKRKRLLKLAQSTSDTYLISLKKINSDTISETLDIAARIKAFTLICNENCSEFNKVFHNPMMLNRIYAEQLLWDWIRDIQKSNLNNDENVLFAAALTIWFQSLAAATFPELKQKGDYLWKELERGFMNCSLFDPESDIPAGFIN